ncbi:DNA repair exonuclease [Candidatus Woesearchaeota archaeon]|nr:DNA repair exonuclease [Candidatus Woesearchaeota archaeon]
MKFAHLADCHVGGWREPELKRLSILHFKEAIYQCIKENVAFILIAGDLFNTSLPDIELIKEVASILKEAHDNDISVYIIPGSHDYSVSGKTMLDVLEKAGLIENVMKLKDNNLEFTMDKTNVKITGLYGRRNSLEKQDYLMLNKSSLEKESGYKIFMFHALLEELKPKDLENVEAYSMFLLPKNFNYYAGGHPHFIYNKNHEGYGNIAYPGPLFPNNFKELEELKQGGFFIVDVTNNKIEHKKIKLKEVTSFFINANDKSSIEIEKELMEKLKEIEDKIVLIRIEGVLNNGKPSDINFREIFSKANAYSILKNTNKLESKEFETIKIEGTVEEIESRILTENLDNIHLKNLTEKEELSLSNNLMNILSREKDEGENKSDFENRIVKDLIKTLRLEEVFENVS